MAATPTATTAATRTFRAILVAQTAPDVETLTLNRPAVLNAIDDDTMEDLLDYFGHLEMAWLKDVKCPRVVILRGSGKGFCAGADLAAGSGATEFASNVASALRAQRKFSEIIVKMRRCPQPIVAVLHGAVCGAGLALALASDVRIAHPSFKANVAMAKIGFTGCDLGISYLLPRVVGLGKASELMMTGRFIQPDAALQLGLLNYVTPDVDTCANDMVRDMLSLTPFALSLTKQGLTVSLGASSLESQIYLEDRQQILAATHPDFQPKVMEFFTRKSKL